MTAADNPHETAGDPRRRPVSDRLVSLSGAAGVALTFGFVALGSHGASPDDPPAEIAAALIDNSDRAEIGALLGLGAALLLMIFVARLHATLKRASDSSHFATLALIGGAAIVAALLINIVVELAQASTTRNAPETAQMLVQVSWNIAAIYAPGFAALMLGTTASCFKASPFPPLIKWLSVALLVLLALIVLVLRAPGLGTAPGSLWVIAISLTLALLNDPDARIRPSNG